MVEGGHFAHSWKDSAERVGFPRLCLQSLFVESHPRPSPMIATTSYQEPNTIELNLSRIDLPHTEPPSPEA